jgi:hypothetical protein
MPPAYTPGSCNIGGEQLFKRKRFLAKCLGLTVWCIALIEILDLARWWRLPMFLLFTLTAIAVQQVTARFCYRFGLKGLSGMDKLGAIEKVDDEASRQRDRRKALRMLVTSLLAGLLLTALYFYLPFC